MPPAPASRWARAVACIAATAGLLHAQAPVPGSEEHWYARNRALLDSAAPDPWAQRTPARETGWRLLPTEGTLIFNSTRPWGRNDGVVWAGRGLTAALQGGVAARWGPVRLRVAPVAFWTQNAAFPLIPNGRSGRLAYGDPRFARCIDLPQRFGDAPYRRVDLGDTELAVTALGLTGGFSSARQIWGPARDYPLVMSTNAGGIPHLFGGTARPIHIGIGTIEGRLIAGRVSQSAWSPVQSGVRARFTSAVTGSFTPRGAPWLTVGGNREVQGPWPAGGLTLDRVLRPFQGVLNDNTGSINANEENGFVSVFFRAGFAPDGLEVYGEMSREDFANDLRWLLQKPDDLAALVLGIAKAWAPDATRLRTLRAELVNGELSHHERLQRGFRVPIPPYTHSKTRQGLTSVGQLLGAPAAYGGAGWTVEWSEASPQGRTAVALERLLQLDWQPIGGNARHPQVTYALRLDRLQRRAGAGDLLFSLTPTYTLNAELVSGRDLFGVSALLRWRAW